MEHKTLTARFWQVLTIINLAALGYPFKILLDADSEHGRMAAAAVFFGIAFVLLITDGISAAIAYFA
jgi:hypothetical protein